MSHKDVPPETESQKACREWWEKAQPTVKRAWGRAQDGSYLAEETRLIHKAWEAASQQSSAEIETLRAEVERLQDSVNRLGLEGGQFMSRTAAAEARAERLAEALKTCLEMEERPKVIELAKAALAALSKEDV